MRKVRFLFALAILSLAAGACSSPAGLDCGPDNAACFGGLGGNGFGGLGGNG